MQRDKNCQGTPENKRGELTLLCIKTQEKAIMKTVCSNTGTRIFKKK